MKQNQKFTKIKAITNKQLILIIILSAILSIILISCSTSTSSDGNGNGNGEEPIVTRVTVSPLSATVLPGNSQAFIATVYGTGSQSVTWSVEGGNSGTNISSNGVLSVDRDETALTLSVRATSVDDSTKSGSASVLVVESTSWEVTNLTTWADAHQGIMNNGGNKLHIITVSGQVVIPPTDQYVNTFGSLNNLTIIIQGEGVLSTSSYGRMFRIGTNQTLILRDISLKGRHDNNGSVVEVKSGGTLRMEGFTKISDNTLSINSVVAEAGGVKIESGGIFVMQDNSEVSNNTNNSTGSSRHAGGVYVGSGYSGGFTLRDNASIKDNVCRNLGGGVNIEGGIFNMEGGYISNNTATSGGGVHNTGIFTMNEGIISHNTVQNSGGGVYGNLIMHGGEILGNTAISSTGSQQGGGVYITNNFTKTGGTIYSNYSEESLRNIAIGGVGHSVYHWRSGAGNAHTWRNATTGPLDFSDRLDFWLNEVDITYEVTHNNWPPTSLTFTFSEDPGNIHADDIMFSDNVSKGSATLTGNGNTRTLSPVSITGNGIIDVTILYVYKISTKTQKAHLIPPAPTFQNATPSASTIRVDWDSEHLTTGYKVYRSSSANGSYALLQNSSINRFVNINLQKTTPYHYRVSCYNTAGDSQFSQISVNTLNNTTCLAIPVSSNSVVIEWPRDDELGIVLSVATQAISTAIDLATSSLGPIGTIIASIIASGQRFEFDYRIYRDNTLIQIVEIPTTLTWTMVPPFFDFVQDSSLVDHFRLDNGLSPNTEYNYRVVVNLQYNFYAWNIIGGDTETVMESSATTFPSSR